MPGANVANFAVHVVVPATAGNRVGDRLGQLMRTGAGQGIECTQTAQTAVAIGIWHGCIKNLAAYVAMVPAECLTGLRPALNHGYAGREIDEVQEVRVRLWKR